MFKGGLKWQRKTKVQHLRLIKKEGYSPDIMVVVLEDSNLPKVAYKTGEKTVAGKTVVAEF